MNKEEYISWGDMSEKEKAEFFKCEPFKIKMSKAEDLSKEFLKKLVSHTTLYKGTIDELEVYEPDDVIWAYKEGYRQAEKDLELTWEDMVLFRTLFDAIDANIRLGSIIQPMTKEYYQEVLKRFKAQKKGE